MSFKLAKTAVAEFQNNRRTETGTVVLSILVFCLLACGISNFQNLPVHYMVEEILPDMQVSDVSIASRVGSQWNISIVVQLSGELGNCLFKVAFGYAIQRILWDDYAIHSHLVLRHQDSSKWRRARRDMQACFPRFRSMDFTLGNSIEFQKRLLQQEEWLGTENASKLVIAGKIHEGLSFLKELLEHSNSVATEPSANISLPFIQTTAFANLTHVDAYYHGLRRLFTFDDEACCGVVPELDEVVFVSAGNY